MNIDALIRDSRLTDPLDQLGESLRDPEHAVSDVVDAAGHQYVDLVMAGGGLRGIALVGYTWALERMGLRLLGVGGTSAGSINALLMAALADPGTAVSPRLLEILGGVDFHRFVDGGADVRDFLDLALNQRPLTTFKLLRLGWRLLAVRERLSTRYGLNPGEHFLYWLSGLLAQAGIATTAELVARQARQPPGLALRAGVAVATTAGLPRGRLVIVAADLWSQTRVEFPRMAELYWSDPTQVNPALYVRGSMAFPFFFEPLRLTELPADPGAAVRWAKHAGLVTAQSTDRQLPTRAMLTDGGLLSNFPIDVFHTPDRVPRLPTFGVRLQADHRVDAGRPFVGDRGLAGLAAFSGMLIDTATRQLDYEFIRRNPDYRHLVSEIPCERVHPDGRREPIPALDFALPAADKELLFRQGAETALAFVRGFASPVTADGRPADPPAAAAYSSKWLFYKELRRRLAQVQATAAEAGG
ncbi:MAG: esterase [Chromatiaceae bacterium]|nr:MAG: esterase [Chromatiaceae bacterium]